ncbi:MAG: hypothetical protein WDW38_008496 [Sanguina aurantia]
MSGSVELPELWAQGRLQFPSGPKRQQLTLPLLPEFPLEQRFLVLVQELARIPATHVMRIASPPLDLKG